MTPLTPPAVEFLAVPLWAWLLLIGVLGAFVRAWRDNAQATWGRETVVDCLVGGVSSILATPVLHYYAPGLMQTFDAVQYQCVIVFLTGFGASFTWVLLIRQRLPVLMTKAADKIDGGIPK